MPFSFSCLIIPFFIFFVFPDLLRCSCPPNPFSLSCFNHNISFPFYTNTTAPEPDAPDPYCRERHKVVCDGSSPIIQFKRHQRWFVLKDINHSDGSIIIQDPELGDQLQMPDCNLSYDFDPPLRLPEDSFLPFSVSQNPSFFNCMPSDYDFSTDTFYETYHLSPCKGYELRFSNKLEDEGSECWKSSRPFLEWRLSFRDDELSILSASYLHQQGRNLNCIKHDTRRDFKCLCNNECQSSKSTKKWIIIACTGGLLLACLLCSLYLLQHKKVPSSIFFWKKKSDNSQSIEAFLERYGSVAPKRYRYTDVRKITRNFRDKLGQGGYGTVFKGSLMDGCLVAVKILSDSKGDGEEFLNEVASIGRTSHVNIVSLLGFCSEGSKRALIYEFMPNGSLEKYIYSEKLTLEWEILYQIAIGIAQGLTYLHRGCNTRIVHFDIKPQNILLDQNFCPKISDFGLAKLCPPKISILSMADPRGTIGYIAPEVFSRNFGAVSSKSDVYSYGMMVLEMVSGRKKTDVGIGKTSEIYFPDGIYEHLEQGGDLQVYGVTEEAEDVARKMILVGLWCIQTRPENRPSMSKVVDMLQGSQSGIQLPPKPYLSSPQGSLINSSIEIASEDGTGKNGEPQLK